jgi:hypothetical protein
MERQMNREPVSQAVNSIIDALEIVARMAKAPETRDEVFAEEGALWTVKNHVEWILSYIKEKQEAAPRIRVVQ